MANFITYIDTIKNVDTLMSLKEHLKNEAVKPMDWESRVDVYHQIQLIVKRIEQVQKQKQREENTYRELHEVR